MLLTKECLIKTGPRDEAIWNYRPLLGPIIRLRYKLLISLLQKECFHRILEIGYGSGVILPTLALHCREVFGIDVHSFERDVDAVLSRNGIAAKLFRSRAEEMPFDDDFFDCVVAVSVLEFIEDLNKALLEIKRVLMPNAVFIAVTPGYSPVLDFGLKLLTNRKAKDEYQNRRELVIPTLMQHFFLQKKLTVPAFGPSLIRLYTGLRLCPT